jgi:hypothetical protein
MEVYDHTGHNTIAFLDTPNTTGSIPLISCSDQGFPIAISLSSHDPAITGAYTFQLAFTGAAIRAGSLMSSGPGRASPLFTLPKRAGVRK